MKIVFVCVVLFTLSLVVMSFPQNGEFDPEIDPPGNNGTVTERPCKGKNCKKSGANGVGRKVKSTGTCKGKNCKNQETGGAQGTRKTSKKAAVGKNTKSLKGPAANRQGNTTVSRQAVNKKAAKAGSRQATNNRATKGGKNKGNPVCRGKNCKVNETETVNGTDTSFGLSQGRSPRFFGINRNSSSGMNDTDFSDRNITRRSRISSMNSTGHPGCHGTGRHRWRVPTRGWNNTTSGESGEEQFPGNGTDSGLLDDQFEILNFQ